MKRFALLVLLLLACGPKPIHDTDGVAGYKWRPASGSAVTTVRYAVRYWVDGHLYQLQTEDQRPFIAILLRGEVMEIDSVTIAAVNSRGRPGHFSTAYTVPVILSAERR